MNQEQERLSRDIANAGADWAIENHHSHLPIEKRIKLHTRYYDAILAGIWAYHDMSGALRIRAIAMASDN